MTKSTSPHDLKTYKVERFLEDSSDGTKIKVEILSRVSKQFEKRWLLKRHIRVGRYDQRLSDIEYYECVKEVKIPVWMALRNGIM